MNLIEWRKSEQPTTAEKKRRKMALRQRKSQPGGISQQEAALRLGISQQYFSLLEAGKRHPSGQLRNRIGCVTKDKVPPETFEPAAAE